MMSHTRSTGSGAGGSSSGSGSVCRERTVGGLVFVLLVGMICGSVIAYFPRRSDTALTALSAAPALTKPPATASLHTGGSVMLAHVRSPQVQSAVSAAVDHSQHPTPQPASLTRHSMRAAPQPDPTAPPLAPVSAPPPPANAAVTDPTDGAVLPTPWPTPTVLSYPLSAEQSSIPVTPKTEKLGEFQTETIHVVPPPSIPFRGWLYAFHGCSHGGSDWFTLPEESIIVKASLSHGIGVVAFTSRDRASGYDAFIHSQSALVLHRT